MVTKTELFDLEDFFGHEEASRILKEAQSRYDIYEDLDLWDSFSFSGSGLEEGSSCGDEDLSSPKPSFFEGFVRVLSTKRFKSWATLGVFISAVTVGSYMEFKASLPDTVQLVAEQGGYITQTNPSSDGYAYSYRNPESTVSISWSPTEAPQEDTPSSDTKSRSSFWLFGVAGLAALILLVGVFRRSSGKPVVSSSSSYITPTSSHRRGKWGRELTLKAKKE